MNRNYYEFFAGGGMARLGLGSAWTCLMANDIDPKKANTYCANFGKSEFVLGDIKDLRCDQMPGIADLAWASFPCQDLSLAGNRNGLAGERSGTFWGFWLAIAKLKKAGRAPNILVLENVVGALTSNDGEDFAEICAALASLNYSFGAVVVDAAHFLPQSRPRLFIICFRSGVGIDGKVVSDKPMEVWHPNSMVKVVCSLRHDVLSRWVWWKLPALEPRQLTLSDLIEIDRPEINWHTEQETKRLLEMMSDANLEKIVLARKSSVPVVGTIYKRTRLQNGERLQRAEVRFDGVAGCLRTPGGGSSRQILIEVNRKAVRTRLLTVREAARLMGVPDSYCLPVNYNEGYHIFGDGLAVPAVRFIREHIIDRLFASDGKQFKQTLFAAE